MITKNWLAFLFWSCISSYDCCARSVFRNPDPDLPAIDVAWEGASTRYRLENSHLEEHPFFKLFDEKYLLKCKLPSGSIAYRNEPAQSVPTKVLNKLIVNLIEQEIKAKKTHFTHFIILQNKGFNHRQACGLLILKFRDYPFVLKLFIETPESFVNPWAKGIEPIFFFYMGGGVNRHLSGFMRLKNLEYINKRIASDPHWNKLVETPRKWFWVDEHKTTWLHITGHNLGKKKVQSISIPGTYAIIADAIEAERTFSSFRSADMQTALDISNFLEANIDLHITNFMVEAKTKKILLIDTEHFPTMVGEVNKHFDGYISWLMHLTGKCAKDMFFSTKSQRRNAQFSSAKHPVPFF